MIAVTKFHDFVKKLKKHEPIAAQILNRELEKGFVPINCDDKHWYPSAEWHNGVVTTDGKNVRLVLLWAKYPYTGSFRWMIEEIRGDGLNPVVIDPSFELVKILKTWKWKARKIGTGNDAEFQWARDWSTLS